MDGDFKRFAVKMTDIEVKYIGVLSIISFHYFTLYIDVCQIHNSCDTETN